MTSLTASTIKIKYINIDKCAFIKIHICGNVIWKLSIKEYLRCSYLFNIMILFRFVISLSCDNMTCESL